MKNKSPLVIGLGEILWDLLPEGKKLGGAPANFAFHCKQLGADAHVFSSVGKDSDGFEIMNILKEFELGTSCLFQDPDHPTGTVSVSLDENGKPDYTIHTGVAWDYIQANEIALALSSQADAVCFGSLAQRHEESALSIQAILEASGKDCLKVFDINLRQEYFTKEVIERSLRLANILKLNDEELLVLSSMFSLKGKDDEKANHLMNEFSLDALALTLGEKGSALYTRSAKSEYSSEPVESIDSVGAGDSFTAALVMGLLRDLPIQEIHAAASDLAAYICTQEGATPVVPRELLTRLLNDSKK